MLQRTLEIQYDNLIIGSDLSALSYAYKNRYNLIYTRLQKPFIYDVNDDWQNKINIWNRLVFNLSFNGYMQFGDKICNLRLDEETLNATTRDNLLIKIKYNNLFLSDDYNLEGLTTNYKNTNTNILVHDYYNVVNGNTKNLNIIDTEDEIAKKIYFYKSTRNQNINLFKDCVSVSLFDSSLLNNENYSHGVIRLKILNEMKKLGITGPKNGNITKFRKPNIIHTKRDVYYLDKKIYSDLPENVFMLDYNWEKDNLNDIRIFR